jgi:crossover junction endodeoxyribonuclease RusA
VTAVRRFELEWDVRPITMNDYRTLHFHPRARHDREWRSAFALLARRARAPKGLDRIIVTAAPFCRRGTTLPDVGACFPGVKAAIDGLVDAGVIPDDTPAHLSAVTFIAPVHAERDSLVLYIEEDPLP